MTTIDSQSPVHSPLLRNAVHIAPFLLLSVPLGFLADPRNNIPFGRSYAASVMLAGTLFNMLVLPRLTIGKCIARPNEGFVTGQWLYPLSMTLCFAFFPPFAAMGAWAAMAAGDAAAGYAGRTFPYPLLPWNRRKTLTGLAGFVIVAFPFCFFAIYWCPSGQFLKSNNAPELPFVWTLAVLAAAGGALLESIDSRIDDNLRVPLGVGLLLWLSGMFLSWATRTLPADTHVQPEQLIYALAINALAGTAVVACRFANLSGTLLGMVFGVIVFFIAQWQGYLLFIVFVACGSGLSKIGLEKKRARGVAEAQEGRRGLRNVAANLLVPVACCLLYPVFGGSPSLLMAFAGALAAALADTASSEVGGLSTSHPVLITTFKPVAHGTNGAVSKLGLTAAGMACLTMTVAAWSSGFMVLALNKGKPVSPTHLFAAASILFLAGIGGTLVDSFLGATIEDKVYGVGKTAVNIACTATGAIVGGIATQCLL